MDMPLNHEIGHHSMLYRVSHNPHVQTELSALGFLIVAAIALHFGLRIAPVFCAVFAALCVGFDLWDWRHPHDDA